MPAVQSIYINIYNQKQVYQAGDELKGEWTVDIGEPFSVKKVSVSFHGAALTRWVNTEPKADDNKGYEEITTQKKIVFPTTDRSGDTVDYPAGKYVYKFCFKIPSGMLPSSYEGKYGAIRYWLSFDIERPTLRSHIRRIKVITVLDDIDVNLPTYSKHVGRKTEKVVKKALGFGNRGTLTLHAEAGRSAYCPGEKIYIRYIAENKSDKDLGRIKADLMQKVMFRASGKERFKYLCLNSINGEELKKGLKLSSLDSTHSITIPAVPPSTKERASHVIKVQYHVKVYIDIPKLNGGEAVVFLPITIGTIPQGHKAVPEAEGASNIPDALSPITYDQCTNGYEDGPRIYSEHKFPRITYVPWCTYVHNFKPSVAKKIVSCQNTTKPISPGKNNISGNTKESHTKVGEASIQPTTGNEKLVQPAASYISARPPTYNEVMTKMEMFPVQKSDETIGSLKSLEREQADEQEKTAETPGHHCIIMVMRFAYCNPKQFRTTFKQNGAKLMENGANIIAIAPQVLVTKGWWPAQTSIAVLSFETFESGSDWFKNFKESSDASGVDILDCSMLKGSDEEPQNEKSVFTLSVLRREGDTTSEEYISLRKKVIDIIKPVRSELGGRLICSGKVEQNLLEQTLSLDKAVSIVQWDSIQQNNEYRAILKEKYKDMITLYGKYFKTEIQTTFQAENTAYMTG